MGVLRAVLVEPILRAALGGDLEAVVPGHERVHVQVALREILALGDLAVDGRRRTHRADQLGHCVARSLVDRGADVLDLLEVGLDLEPRLLGDELGVLRPHPPAAVPLLDARTAAGRLKLQPHLALGHRRPRRAPRSRFARQARLQPAGRPITRAVGLGFERAILVDADPLGLRRRLHPPLPLLHHVGQLVADERLAGEAARREAARREVHPLVAGHRVGAEGHRRRRAPDEPHAGEVGVERALHLPAQRRGDGLSAAALPIEEAPDRAVAQAHAVGRRRARAAAARGPAGAQHAPPPGVIDPPCDEVCRFVD